ncbi:MAG: diguanylate cyclase [Deinococcales bacterium]
MSSSTEEFPYSLVATLANAALGSALLDLNGVVREVNAAYCALLGLQREDLLGATTVVHTHPDDRATDARLLHELLSGQRRSYVIEKRYLHRDGRILWVLLGMSLVHARDGSPIGILKQLQDITAQKEAEAALAHSDRQQRQILASLHDGVVLQDAEGRIIYANASAARILGTSLPELLDPTHAQAPWDPAHHGGRPQPTPDHPAVRALRSGQPQNDVIMTVDRPDGSQAWVRVNAQPLLHAGASKPHAVVTSLHDLTTLRKREQELRHQALHDALTGLPNRRTLDRRLAQLMRQDHLASDRHALAYLDLDGFKAINDRYGHDAGDRLLGMVAQRLATCLRDDDLLVRIAGDEFVAVLAHVTPTEAANAGQRMIDALSRPFAIDGFHVRVGASAGIATLSSEHRDPATALAQADAALREAKAQGKSRCLTFDPTTNTSYTLAANLERDVRHAINRQQFRIRYQPITRLRDGAFAGAMLDLTWHHPHYGALTPDQFLPATEDAGLLARLSLWATNKALQDAKRWRTRPSTRHAFLVAPLPPALLTDDLPRRLTLTLQRHHVPPAALALGVRAADLARHADTAQPILQRVAKSGIRLLLADTGHGPIDLPTTLTLPFRYVQLSATLLRNPAATQPHNLLPDLIRSLQNAGMRCIAHLPHTNAHLPWLHDSGCRYLQDPHRPLEPERP